MSTLASPPPHRRVPGSARTVLAWSGAVLSPVLLFCWLDFSKPPNASFGLRLVMPVVATALLAGVLPRRPFVALPMVFLNMIVVEAFSAPVLLRDPGLHAGLRALQMVAVDVAVGYVAATHRRRVSVVTAVVALVVQVHVAFMFKISPTDGNASVIQAVLAMVTAWLIGNAVRQRREFVEAQRAEAASHAVEAERLRIARELHDMIAHSIGVIAIQAGMGRRVIDSQPDEARKALAAIEETGRDTLAALRRMLGTLRRADAGPGSAPLDPTPGLADLDRLTERTRDAGVDVEVRSVGERRPLPPDVDLSAFRIIQEAVTNVVRHAGTRRCQVVVAQRPDELSIEVTDDGRGGAVGAGYGIPGMRERVSLLGGEFAAGPRPEGGFRVAARIPVPDGTR
ncbi:sensor histidine kinase [Planosporangium sp. 12N6]|uniref:sensor histidine kinase n=1 Tax=Planosporangium spinosum TaxID=3402278 RepID=UPI003CE68D12